MIEEVHAFQGCVNLRLRDGLSYRALYLIIGYMHLEEFVQLSLHTNFVIMELEQQNYFNSFVSIQLLQHRQIARLI